MSQATDLTLSPNISGTEQRVELNDIIASFGSCHRGSSRPGYVLSGMLWVDDSANPIWSLKFYDGADDITLGTINTSTNQWVGSNAMQINGSSIYAAAGGGANAYTVTNSSIPTLQAGQLIVFKANAANTASATVNVNGGGALTLKKNGSQNLAANDIVADQMVIGVYDGTNVQVISRLNTATETYNLSAKTSLVNNDGFRIFDSAAGNIEKKLTFSDFKASLSAALPKGHASGPVPLYTSSASITLPTKLQVRDSSNTVDIVLSTDITLSLAAAGAAGLDTGTEAASTWYYVYLIMKADGTVSAVFSTTNESVTGTITLPSGYIYKRQLPFAVRNDSSSNIIPFIVLWMTGSRAKWRYDVPMTYMSATNTFAAGPTCFLNNGTANTDTNISASSQIPPIAKAVDISIVSNNAQGRVFSGGTTNYVPYGGIHTSTGAIRTMHYICDIPPNSSQQIGYNTLNGNVTYMDVAAVTAEVA